MGAPFASHASGRTVQQAERRDDGTPYSFFLADKQPYWVARCLAQTSFVEKEMSPGSNNVARCRQACFLVTPCVILH